MAKENFDYAILDTAAGTHCSVVVGLLDVDKAVAVTEPTPMGAHDLGLILELLTKLNVKADVLLNQSDLGDLKAVKQVLVKHHRKNWDFEIPYSRDLATAYSQSQLLTAATPKIDIS